MDNVEVVLFDLFFTLVKPSCEKNEEDNEYYVLNLSREEWEEIVVFYYLKVNFCQMRYSE